MGWSGLRAAQLRLRPEPESLISPFQSSCGVQALVAQSMLKWQGRCLGTRPLTTTPASAKISRTYSIPPGAFAHASWYSSMTREYFPSSFAAAAWWAKIRIESDTLLLLPLNFGVLVPLFFSGETKVTLLLLQPQYDLYCSLLLR